MGANSIRLAAGIAMLCSLLAGPATHAREHGAQPPLRVGSFLSAIDYAPFYVARNMGCIDALARSAGRQLDYKVYTSIPGVNDAVESGTLDIILEADSPAILQRAAGGDIQEITPLATLSQQLLVPDDSRISRMADLRGKRIGVLFGSGYHFAVVDGLAAAHLGPADYVLVDTAPTDGPAALADGKIDAWAIWPPILQREQLAHRGLAIAGSASTLNVYAFGRATFMRHHPAIVSGFMRCMRQGIAFIKHDKKATIAIIAAETGIQPELIARAWPTMAFGFQADREQFRVLNAQAGFMFEHGFAQRAVKFEPKSFYDLGRNR